MIKKVRKSISSGDKQAATTEFQTSQSRIDSIAGKNVVDKNSVSRYKSRLSAAIKAMP